MSATQLVAHQLKGCSTVWYLQLQNTCHYSCCSFVYMDILLPRLQQDQRQPRTALFTYIITATLGLCVWCTGVVVGWATWMTSLWSVYRCCSHASLAWNCDCARSPTADWRGSVVTTSTTAVYGDWCLITRETSVMRRWPRWPIIVLVLNTWRWHAVHELPTPGWGGITRVLVWKSLVLSKVSKYEYF